jgi:hypothetical protein
MSILGAIVDEQQHAMIREPIDQAPKKGRGLGIDPVQVLDDETEWLNATLRQEQAPQPIQDPRAALGRVEVPPVGIFHRHGEEREKGGQERLQFRIEYPELACHLLVNAAGSVPALDVEVRLQEIDHRQVGGTLLV